MNSSPYRSGKFRAAAFFGLLFVVFVDVEMYRWFDRTHDPAELLQAVGAAGFVTGAYAAWLSPRGRRQPISSAVIGAVIGLNFGWLVLMLVGVRELFRLGVL